jgi:hypothetical protein
MPNIQVYLASEKGYEGVVGTTLGLLPFSIPFAIILGAFVGVAGGLLHKGWKQLRVQA